MILFAANLVLQPLLAQVLSHHDFFLNPLHLIVHVDASALDQDLEPIDHHDDHDDQALSPNTLGSRDYTHRHGPQAPMHAHDKKDLDFCFSVSNFGPLAQKTLLLAPISRFSDLSRYAKHEVIQTSLAPIFRPPISVSL